MLDGERLRILTEGAKYDVSCSSSGSNRKNKPGGLGNGLAPGCCHTFTPDGRCVSLLKILMTNNCVFDCQYCLNRRSNDVPRASATPDELAELVVNFYKRNYIEGLFLSSAVEKSPNETMERLLRVVVLLRTVYNFNGYIHLKGIPHADREIVIEAGKYADRMSFNIELPSESSLKLLAPQKDKESILGPMKLLTSEKYNYPGGKNSDFLPAGQTTQMIVGASPETDGSIIKLTQNLYSRFSLKRVYYSSYIPLNPDNPNLPAKPAGLLREHRLYQADWLLRFYGFTADEIVNEEDNLDEGYDPKCAWALRNMHLFPVEVNRAPFEMLLRIPGVGLKGANRIVHARKYTKLQYEDLVKMRIVMKRAAHFILCDGKFMGIENDNTVKKNLYLLEKSDNSEQLSLFSTLEAGLEALTGEL